VPLQKDSNVDVKSLILERGNRNERKNIERTIAS